MFSRRYFLENVESIFQPYHAVHSCIVKSSWAAASAAIDCNRASRPFETSANVIRATQVRQALRGRRNSLATSLFTSVRDAFVMNYHGKESALLLNILSVRRRHLPRKRLLPADIGARSYLARAKYSQQLLIVCPLRVKRRHRSTHRNRHFVLLVDSSFFVRTSLAMVR